MSALSPARVLRVTQALLEQLLLPSARLAQFPSAHSKLGRAQGISGRLWVHSVSCSQGRAQPWELRGSSSSGGFLQSQSLKNFTLRAEHSYSCPHDS